MKLLKNFLFTLLISLVAGLGIAAGTGITPAAAVGGLVITSFIPKGTGAGVLQAGLYTEVWTGELVKRFTHSGTFLEGVPDYSRYVGNDVIHLVDVGAHPSVLINNSSYPLPVNPRTDGDLPISLDKFDTEATSVTKDEMYALSYDKMKITNDLHREALQMKTLDKSIYNFAPASDAEGTPVVKTSGGDNGNGFKKLLPGNIRTLKRKFDDAKVPKDDRRLVLCAQHVEDLLSIDETFEKQYNNIREGEVLKMYGFKIYEYVEMPLYDAAFAKKAFGAAPAGTDRESSVAFYAKRMFQAKSSMGVDTTLPDARNKTNEVSMDMRFIALPKKLEAIGAIVNESVV
ncbi:MAG: hypothetical protein U9N85_07650 [Bacteroidota bacterium]|nr:hypothetical protein [Bacteroidota bacterium]